MVTTLTNYLDSRYIADVNEGYDGVVRVAIGGYYGTGVLLYGGQAVLTAAHLFYGTSETKASVYLQTSTGNTTINNNSFSIISSYDPNEGNDDLAIVWLSQDAPSTAERYTLYREDDEISQIYTMVGYGTPGTGKTGSIANYNEVYRLMTQNRFDADAGELKDTLGSVMAWTPTSGTQLVADFDNGTASNDALGSILGTHDLGVGTLEGLIAAGDSGGPAFIDGKVAGIASYVTSLSTYTINPDVDNVINSSFGEIGAWQRVSYYQQWIDQSIREHYVDAPTKVEEVQKMINEGNSGVSYVYFLLQFTGIRSNVNEWISVDYTTRDGSATSNSDYISVDGTLILYPDENQAVIPVEIIGDTIDEADEVFYLDVFNPVGGSFGEGIVKLTAVRTILDDDGF